MPIAAIAALLAISVAVEFATGVEAVRSYPASVLAAVMAVASSLVLIAFGRRSSRSGSASVGTGIVAFLAGGLGLFGAPYAVLSHRYSDAPSGSEILFLTTAAWAVLLVLPTLRAKASRLTVVSGALLVLTGVAATVGNWERPSSFSPFIRYASEEVWMLAAGLAWAFMWWLLDRSIRRGDHSAVLVPMAAGGIGASLVSTALSGWHSFTALGEGSFGLGLLFLASAVATAAAFTLLRRAGLRGVAGGYTLPAAALTALTWLEQTTGAFGPQPILIVPAVAGAMTTLAGAILWWVPDEETTQAIAPPWLALLAWASVAAAVVGLAVPALRGHATGLRASGESFDAQFVLLGWEAVGPWLALGISVGVVGTLMRRSVIAKLTLALGTALAAWPLVAWTPLHTLTTFIPWEVQVDFGSEFAAIEFTRLAVPFSYAAVCGAAVALALSWVVRPKPVQEESAARGEG